VLSSVYKIEGRHRRYGAWPATRSLLPASPPPTPQDTAAGMHFYFDVPKEWNRQHNSTYSHKGVDQMKLRLGGEGGSGGGGPTAANPIIYFLSLFLGAEVGRLVRLFPIALLGPLSSRKFFTPAALVLSWTYVFWQHKFNLHCLSLVHNPRTQRRSEAPGIQPNL